MYYVYILTNLAGTVLYTGVSSDLIYRVWQHKQKLVPGFSSKYNVDRLVYFECGEDVFAVLEREKRIKGGSRRGKLALINKMNPEWRDLYVEIANDSAVFDDDGRLMARPQAVLSTHQ